LGFVDVSGRILQGDARKALGQVDSESVHLVLTSPPYNVGMEYDEHDDQMSWDYWGELLEEVFYESWRALVPGGRMAVNVAHSVDRNPALPVGNTVERMLLALPGALYRGPVIWYKRHSVSSTGWGSYDSPSNPVLRGTFEMVYVVSKGRPDRPDRSGKGDLPRKDYVKASLDVWEVTPTSDHKAAGGHPAPFPVELVRRMLQFYTWPGDHVLDPFAGSGTTAVAAEHLGRDWTMVEISPDYCKTIQRRTMLFEGLDQVSIEEF
jgi:site-specific DNA-methyltransferase (adenine-specific)